MSYFSEQTDMFLQKKKEIEEEIGHADAELEELNGRYEKKISEDFEKEVIDYLKDFHKSAAILCEEIDCAVMKVDITLKSDLTFYSAKLVPIALSEFGTANYQERVDAKEIEYVPSSEKPMLDVSMEVLPTSTSYNTCFLGRVIIAYDKDVKDHQHASILNGNSKYPAVKTKEIFIQTLNHSKEDIQSKYADVLDHYLEKTQTELDTRRAKNNEVKEKLER